jgi:uncharacterized protein (DUF4415 family)
MKRKSATVRTSADKIAAQRRKGASRTDWARVDRMSEAELEASIAADPDDVRETPDWTRAVTSLPPRKEPIKLRVDSDVLGWFRATGKGYQTRINNVLRAFVESRKNAAR